MSTTDPRIESGAHVWGPPFWFILHSMAMTYPVYPNDITKRKYYDFVQNIPLFLPNEEMGNRFADMLDKYPVSPYLDNRASFWRWTVFIHNKINVQLGKMEMEMEEASRIYFDKYEIESPVPVSITGKNGSIDPTNNGWRSKMACQRADEEVQRMKRSSIYFNTAIILSLILVLYFLLMD